MNEELGHYFEVVDLVLNELVPHVQDSHVLVELYELLRNLEQLRQKLKALEVNHVVEQEPALVLSRPRRPPQLERQPSLLAHEISERIQDANEHQGRRVEVVLVVGLELDDFVEEVPNEAVDREVLFKLILEGEHFFFINCLLDEPEELFVPRVYQGFYVHL